MRQCIWFGILASFPLCALAKSSSIVDDECHATQEKELLQSTGKVNNKMEAVEERGSGFGIHPTKDFSKCFDIPDNNAVNTAQLQIWDCNGSPAQQFAYNADDNTLRPSGHYSMCVDAAIPQGGVPQAGAKIILYQCWGGQNQQWTMVPAMRAQGYAYFVSKNFPGLCISSPYENSAKLELEVCKDTGSLVAIPAGASQFFPGVFPGFPIQPKVNSKMCFDIPDANFANGNKLQIWDCNGSPAQSYYYNKADSTIRPKAAVTKCLDATSKPAAGAAVLLYDCNNEKWQKWTLTEDSMSQGYTSVKLQYYDLCAADAKKTYEKSAPLTVEECTDESKTGLPGVVGMSIYPLIESSVCLTMSGGKVQKESKVVMYTCANKEGLPFDSQNWQYWPVDNSIRSTVDTSLCLDVWGGKAEEGQFLQLYPCHGKENQQFVMGDNELKIKSQDLCVADPKHEYSSGTVVELIKCTAPESKQKIHSFKVPGLEGMGVTWLKPNDFEKPQCSDGEIAWNCNEVGHGPRISCPKEWPYMCNDPNQCSGDTASEKKDRCCSKDKATCEGGPRPDW